MPQAIEYLVIGLGKTGFSCVNYLCTHQKAVAVVDTRVQPPYLVQLRQEYPQITFTHSDNELEILNQYLEQVRYLVLSPGVALSQTLIKQARELDVEIINDIELFAKHHISVPIIGITGSNGKSTVTDMLGFIANKLGIKAGVGGNLGTCALDLLDDNNELYILELSSFQLEWVSSLKLAVGTILNITPDHLDRYESFTEYAQTKGHIFSLSNTAVVNTADKLVSALLPKNITQINYRASTPTANAFGLTTSNNQQYISYGGHRLLNTNEIALQGAHQLLNILCVFSIVQHLNWPLDQVIAAVKTYPGLEHRCQLVASYKGVKYINDSKATNVGATLAAIGSIGTHISGKIVLILGGQTKGGDLSVLIDSIKQYVKATLLIGEDAELIEQQLGTSITSIHATSLEVAISKASSIAQEGDIVLLSPACASLDNFTSFAQRGEVFIQQVKQMTDK
jgi:UDP-N-acetylmuramoylalanine--D-glutamate ligase